MFCRNVYYLLISSNDTHELLVVLRMRGPVPASFSSIRTREHLVRDFRMAKDATECASFSRGPMEVPRSMQFV